MKTCALSMALAVGLAVVMFAPVWAEEAEGAAPEIETATEFQSKTGIAVEDAAGAANRRVAVKSGTDLMQALRSVLSVVVVLGALIGLNFYIRRRGVKIGRHGGERIKVVERAALDARRQVVLIEVGRRQVLIAVGPQQIATLGEWQEEDRQ